MGVGSLKAEVDLNYEKTIKKDPVMNGLDPNMVYDGTL